MARLPDDILKQGEVQDEQLSRLLQGHPIVGHLLLTYYMGGSHFGNCRVALYHHERKNGMGYPGGIHLNDDVVELITIADAFDALLSVRPYRKEPFDLRSALDLLWVEGKKGMFNPELVKLLIAYSRKDAGSSEEARIAEEQRIPGPASNRYVNWAAYQLSKKKCVPPGN